MHCTIAVVKSETSRLKLRSGPALGRKTKIENVRSELLRLVDEHADQLRDKLSPTSSTVRASAFPSHRRMCQSVSLPVSSALCILMYMHLLECAATIQMANLL